VGAALFMQAQAPLAAARWCGSGALPACAVGGGAPFGDQLQGETADIHLHALAASLPPQPQPATTPRPMHPAEPRCASEARAASGAAAALDAAPGVACCLLVDDAAGCAAADFLDFHDDVIASDLDNFLVI
jgi:hypothetical protein